jgi:hypothetical protein
MKHKYFFVACSFIALIFAASCAKDSSVSSTSKQLVISRDFVIQSGDSVFEEDGILDANNELASIGADSTNIESVSLNKSTVQVVSYNGPADQSFLQAYLECEKEDNPQKYRLFEFHDVLVNSLVNKEMEQITSDYGVSELTELIQKAPHKLKVEFEGRSIKKPIQITVRVNFYLQITLKN